MDFLQKPLFSSDCRQIRKILVAVYIYFQSEDIYLPVDRKRFRFCENFAHIKTTPDT